MKKAIRTGRIEIDTIKLHGPKWIVATISTLELDDQNQVVSERIRDLKLYRKVSNVATETVTITDPVTGQPITVSVAGIGGLIKAIMIQWMQEDFPATYDPEIDLVVINDTGQ